MKKYIMISVWILIGLFIGTIAGYRCHLKRCESRAGYYFVKGLEYYDKQDYRHAAEMLNRSIGADPKNPDLAMLRLSGAYRNLGFDDLARETEKLNETSNYKSME